MAQQNYTSYNSLNSGLTDNSTTCLAVDTNNLLWVGSQGGLNSFDGVFWEDHTGDLPSPSVRCLELDSMGGLWVGTLGGLARYDGFAWTHFDTSNGLFNNQVNCVAFDSLNNPWVGTSQGLYRYDGRNWHVELDSSALEPTFVNITKLRFVKDSLIICTMNGGIGYLYNGIIDWYSSFLTGLPDNSSFDVELTEGGSRLFACPQGGLLMHFFSGQWFNWNIINSPGFPSNSLTCLEKLDSNLFLAGTLGAGVFEFSFQLGQPVTSVFDTTNHFLPDNYVSDIIVDLNGSVWIGTISEGVVLWGGASSVFENSRERRVVGEFDLLGRKKEALSGFIFRVYSDGSTEKLFYPN